MVKRTYNYPETRTLHLQFPALLHCLQIRMYMYMYCIQYARVWALRLGCLWKVWKHQSSLYIRSSAKRLDFLFSRQSIIFVGRFLYKECPC